MTSFPPSFRAGLVAIATLVGAMACIEASEPQRISDNAEQRTAAEQGALTWFRTRREPLRPVAVIFPPGFPTTGHRVFLAVHRYPDGYQTIRYVNSLKGLLDAGEPDYMGVRAGLHPFDLTEEPPDGNHTYVWTGVRYVKDLRLHDSLGPKFAVDTTRIKPQRGAYADPRPSVSIRASLVNVGDVMAAPRCSFSWGGQRSSVRWTAPPRGAAPGQAVEVRGEAVFAHPLRHYAPLDSDCDSECAAHINLRCESATSRPQ